MIMQTALSKWQIMPPMSDEERKLLKDDIREKGIQEPIIFDQNGRILDGHHRFEIFSELIDEGVDLPMFPKIDRKIESDEQGYDLVLSLNLKRRHLTPEGRRQIVFTLRKRGLTLSRIAQMVGVTTKTISLDVQDLTDAERAELEQVPVVAQDGRTFASTYAPRLEIKITTGEQQIARQQTVMRGEEAPAPKNEQANDLLIKWPTVSGDVWVIPSKNTPGRSHRLMCGSSTSTADGDLIKLMAGEFARLAVTSPPYNQLQTFVERMKTEKGPGMFAESPAFHERMESAYEDNLDEDEYQKQQVLLFWYIALHTTDDASFFYNHKNRYRNAEVISPTKWITQEEAWKWRSEIVWDRGGSITLNARMFIPCDERIYWLVRDTSNFYFNDLTEIKAWTTVWRIAAHNEVSVSAAFPNEIARRPILACSEVGDIVLEPYAGSGTVMAESERASRICYAMEHDPKYCAVILQRMADMGLEPTRG